MKIDQYEIGQKIRRFRKRAGLSQFDLELKIGASPGSVSRIENGEVNPTKETIVKIIEVLNLGAADSTSLFGIDINDNLGGIVHSTKVINKKLNLNYVFQSSVNEIVYELGLLSGFISMLFGDNLCCRTTTQNWVIDLCSKFIPSPITDLVVNIEKDRDNLIVKSHNEKTIVVREDNILDFIVPAVNVNIAKILIGVSGAKSGISLPIILNNESIGVIFFCKNHESDFSDEIETLKIFTESLAIAINNARKYEELESKYKELKNGKK